MLNRVKRIGEFFGLDLAIIYSILGKVIQAGGGVISIVFILLYLSKNEQGYYYTFGSIIAIQIFFELGLGTIITQYVAHETADLYWENGILKGSVDSLSRLSSLLKIAVKWFSLVSILLLITLLLVGYYFFSNFNNNVTVNWQWPWAVLAFSTSLFLILSPVLSFIEGLGKVKEIALVRLVQQLIYTIILFLGFYSGLKLFSGGVALIISFFAVSIYFLIKFKKLLIYLWTKLDQAKVNYLTEIFPYQWKIALSWISGYFIFQLFNPVIFATEGPVAAGQMGMTLAILNGITALSLTWINTKVPMLSAFIAKKDYTKLDLIFNQTIKQMILMSFIMFTVLGIIVFFLRLNEFEFAKRFIDNISLLFLCLATFINIIINGLATYLRCHKKEPYLILSILMGVLTTISTLLLGKYYGVLGISVGYFIVIGPISFTYAYHIFIKRKGEWHSN